MANHANAYAIIKFNKPEDLTLFTLKYFGTEDEFMETFNNYYNITDGNYTREIACELYGGKWCMIEEFEQRQDTIYIHTVSAWSPSYNFFLNLKKMVEEELKITIEIQGELTEEGGETFYNFTNNEEPTQWQQEKIEAYYNGRQHKDMLVDTTEYQHGI